MTKIMKKLFTLLFVGLITLTANAQEKATTIIDPNAPAFEFESEVIDYGKIEYKANGLRTFKFKNIGKSPLIISRIQSSCGCTTPKKPEGPIMPGETGEIDVKYATNRVGGFSKTITVYSNATEKMKRLRIKGIVGKNPALTTKKASK